MLCLQGTGNRQHAKAQAARAGYYHNVIWLNPRPIDRVHRARVGLNDQSQFQGHILRNFINQGIFCQLGIFREASPKMPLKTIHIVGNTQGIPSFFTIPAFAARFYLFYRNPVSKLKIVVRNTVGFFFLHSRSHFNNGTDDLMPSNGWSR